MALYFNSGLFGKQELDVIQTNKHHNHLIQRLQLQKSSWYLSTCKQLVNGIKSLSGEVLVKKVYTWLMLLMPFYKSVENEN